MGCSLDQVVALKSPGQELLSAPKSPEGRRGRRSRRTTSPGGDQLPQRSERRFDLDRRRRLELLSREELIRELCTDHLTGLPNRRAYEEAEPKACLAVLDLDGLKWVNDQFGHPAGDALIRTAAMVLASADLEVYRMSGDEFICQFESDAEAQEKLAAVAHRLEHASFIVPGAPGRVRLYRGIGISYGIGRSLRTAEAALRRAKTHRQGIGLRAARGERPPMLQRIRGDRDGEPGHRAEITPLT